ncbi:MAG: hypothetical protein QNJ53_27295 [Pleurocapsa sp. MO_192.B19]|nr:hypothetical protein [Pleurocapsa sp. MO_192.B19]
MAHSQPKSSLWSTSNSSEFGIRNSELGRNKINYELRTPNSELLCLNSSNECVKQITSRALANSSKLKQSKSRIALIEQRLAVTEDRIDYTSKKKWTNYISTDPVNIIQNLFGGGGVQRDNLAIANLEIRTTDLLAAKAELERQQEEEKLKIEDEVLRLVLDYEASERRYNLLTSQLETLEQQREVIRIAYRLGRGSTSQILGMESRRDRISEQIVDVEIKQDESVRKLKQLTRGDKVI